MYAWTFPRTLVVALKSHGYRAWRYYGWFWHTNSFAAARLPLRLAERCLALLVGLGMLLQIITGIVFLVTWARFGTAGYWEFGLALLLSYPITWALLLGLEVAVWHGLFFVAHPKKAGRAVVCTVLERQIIRLRKRHQFQLVAVAGSVGKTSTKLAIANLLGQHKRVRHQAGNYNDRVTVPLVFFGGSEPQLFNVWAWLKIFSTNNAAIRRPYPYDVVVVEIGTDGPGYMKEFAYLQPDITVVSAITPEHMEHFETLDAVAAEELGVFDYSKRVLINGDDVPGMYLMERSFSEYSVTASEASYYAKPGNTTISGQKLQLALAGKAATSHTQYLGVQGAKIALAAAAVADMLGISTPAIAKGLPELKAFSGRMQLLHGIKDATLIDDTYNASPIAVKAALDVLYELNAPQHIAILGSMNELGEYSPEAHREVGRHCNPKKLDIVVTIGADAKQYLAPEAKAKGCTVKTFMSPYAAGEYVRKHSETSSVILAKGSQNGVFAEEALKLLLSDPANANKLVRQSPYWLTRKRTQFGD